MGAGTRGLPGSAGRTPGAQLVGYRVEATDGTVGKVDRHTEDVGRTYLVVDTGPWIFGHRVTVPADEVSRVDEASRTVYVDATREQIKGSPYFESGRDDENVASLRLIEEHYANRHM
ncbi:PRC-barrel domain containing protein [Streptomyces formicae]|uniref:PRC-barrel domain containing protein n=1 Tax=Streptomyces formicae TaxID=1616117 RepID=A0ABY3WQ54_9ACTN|nr:PRC-barrel domain containing protein [Streptomyces formicae]UNM12665.1 PRC-barrel domain containing protein [Streptomyces formicae]